MSFVIRPAEPADLHEIAELFSPLRAGEGILQIAADLGDELHRRQTRLLVLEAGAPRALVGALLAWLVLDELTILDVAIAGAHRRAGHGRALVAELLRRSGAEGAKLAVLEVRASNAPARALYRALGFDEARVRRGYYADGEDGVELHAHLP